MPGSVACHFLKQSLMPFAFDGKHKHTPHVSHFSLLREPMRRRLFRCTAAGVPSLGGPTVRLHKWHHVCLPIGVGV